MRTEHARIAPNTTYPVAEETGILSGREALLGPTLCGKKELSLLSVRHTQVVINCLPGLFGDLESYRLAGLLLPDRCALNGVSMRSNVLELESDDITTAQFAIDSEIEQRQVALAVCHLKLSADRPDVLRPQRRLAPVNLPLFQGVRLDVAGDGFSLSCISFSSFVRMTSMASIQPLPLSDRRPLTGVDLPRPALVGEAVRDPKRSLAELRHLARTKSSQFTFGGQRAVLHIVPMRLTCGSRGVRR